MHLSSLDNMKKFRDRYLAGMENTGLEIFDLGSMAIGGCYRSIFDAEKWTYTGVDLSEGENVDLVLSDPYSWSEIRSSSVDVFVSGQAFEHIEFFGNRQSAQTGRAVLYYCTFRRPGTQIPVGLLAVLS